MTAGQSVEASRPGREILIAVVLVESIVLAVCAAWLYLRLDANGWFAMTTRGSRRETWATTSTVMVVTFALSLAYCLYRSVTRRRVRSLVLQAILLVATVVVIAWAHRNIPPPGITNGNPGL